MKPTTDAYGQELYALYKGENKTEIIEREDGLIDASNATGYLAPFKDWSPHQKKAMKYVQGKVLDIGCGAGRHALHLQEKGYDVLGIDLSPLAVKVCKSRGLKKARAISITQISSKLGTFDTLLMLGNNFGLMASLKRARWLLKKFYRMTGENARIIAETLDPYQTTDPSHLAYHKQNRKRGRMSGQVRIRVRYRQYVGQWMDYLFVSKNEMQKILEGTGWHIKHYLDSSNPVYIAIIERNRNK